METGVRCERDDGGERGEFKRSVGNGCEVMIEIEWERVGVENEED